MPYFLGWCWRWAWTNGVPGNLTASVITWIAAFSAGVAVGKRTLRPHLTRLEELHRLMHHVHAEKAAELGHTIPVPASPSRERASE